MGRFSFNCTAGCGACDVRLGEFEAFRSETHDGVLLKQLLLPKIESTCCGSDVEVWDAVKDRDTGDLLGVLEEGAKRAAQGEGRTG